MDKPDDDNNEKNNINETKTDSFGFIITRHVNSEQTNKYWNYSIQCIRRFYSSEHYKIVIIDDNSNQDLLKAEFDYKNVEYIQSEFPGRGELLPYYYFYKNRFFDKAVIMHDSVFFQKKIHFNKIVAPVLPLWHFDFARMDDTQRCFTLTNVLKNNHKIREEFSGNNASMPLSISDDIKWMGCFGVQCFIRHDFVSHLQQKYNLFKLLEVVRIRRDRCCLERIMGVIFYQEFPLLQKRQSLLGAINRYCKWGYTFREYCDDISTKKNKLPLVKVWTGR